MFILLGPTLRVILSSMPEKSFISELLYRVIFSDQLAGHYTPNQLTDKVEYVLQRHSSTVEMMTPFGVSDAF